MNRLDDLTRKIVDLDYETACKITQRALAMDFTPMDIINAINKGMDEVGRLYEQGIYSIADLMMAGVIFEDVLDLDGMQFEPKGNEVYSDTILLGTIEGDIHDIGKAIFHSLAVSAGFKVIDLGINVPCTDFYNKAVELQPSIIAISAILSSTLSAVQHTVHLLKTDERTKDIQIILGGALANLDCNSLIGADTFANSAKEGVEECQRLRKIFQERRNLK